MTVVCVEEGLSAFMANPLGDRKIQADLNIMG